MTKELEAKELEALVKSVREKHYPYFAKLEAAMRKKLPHANEVVIAWAVCSLIEQLDAEEEEVLCDANPGLNRVQ
jgi:hypothetical protein